MIASLYKGTVDNRLASRRHLIQYAQAGSYARAISGVLRRHFFEGE
jgi:hypothetical protein